MGAMDVLYSFGFKYDNPDKPYDMEGFVNSDKAVAGLEFYKSLYDCCSPPGMSNAYMGEGVDAFKSGQVAMRDPMRSRETAMSSELVPISANTSMTRKSATRGGHRFTGKLPRCHVSMPQRNRAPPTRPPTKSIQFVLASNAARHASSSTASRTWLLKSQ
jgi:hypothetical protein